MSRYACPTRASSHPPPLTAARVTFVHPAAAWHACEQGRVSPARAYTVRGASPSHPASRRRPGLARVRRARDPGGRRAGGGRSGGGVVGRRCGGGAGGGGGGFDCLRGVGSGGGPRSNG